MIDSEQREGDDTLVMPDPLSKLSSKLNLGVEWVNGDCFSSISKSKSLKEKKYFGVKCNHQRAGASLVLSFNFDTFQNTLCHKITV